MRHRYKVVCYDTDNDVFEVHPLDSEHEDSRDNVWMKLEWDTLVSDSPNSLLGWVISVAYTETVVVKGVGAKLER